jgi:UDP-perosamine 4-acetyltransferase
VILILGAGGHARPVIEALRAMGVEPAGLLDDATGGSILGVEVVGPIRSLAERRMPGLSAVIAIGDNGTRARLGALCVSLGVALPAVIHPAAFVSPSARIAEGAQVMARAVIGPGATVGALALVNTGAIVEHDCAVGDGAHLGPGVVLCGGVTVGARALVGAGVVARPGIAIGADAVVAAGAAVSADVPAGARMGGVPARPI